MPLEAIVSVVVLLAATLLISFVLLSTFDLTKQFVRGLETLLRNRFSLAKLLGWTALAAIWMAMTRRDPATMMFGLLALGIVIVILVGSVEPG